MSDHVAQCREELAVTEVEWACTQETASVELGRPCRPCSIWRNSIWSERLSKPHRQKVNAEVGCGVMS